MFSWFENRIDPFPAEEPEQPPATLLAFCWHYTKGIWPWLALMAVLIAAVSWIWYDQRLDLPALAGLGLIFLGVLVVNLFSNSMPH